MTFEQLGLSAPILKALGELGYERPSPIQEKAIPPALDGRDVLGCAQTGTGKTCAFAAPILQRLDRPAAGRPIRALILTPTRELAIQIGDSFSDYGKYSSLRHAVIFGGVGQNPQVEALKQGVDILVATPGRLMDLYQQGFVHLEQLEIFVLDEADRMLDMGFIHDVKKILKWLPDKKQTMLFSATMPKEITNLVDSLLHDPARVAVDPISSPVEAIRQWVCFVDKGNKTRLIAHLMEERKVKNAIVFTRTKHGANKVARDLVKEGVSAAAIHGNKSQTARQQALGDFKAGKLRCLVATDIAARGLDIEELSHVFNYNLPEVPETYVHRIGRTGRAGHGGEAIALCDFGEKPLLKEIEKMIHRSIPVLEDHPYPMEVFEAPKRDKQGRVINEEDAEARAAAREKRRERAESQKAAAREKRQSAQEQKEQAVQVLEESSAQEKSSRRRKKKARKTEEAPCSQLLQDIDRELEQLGDYEDPITYHHEPRSRGVRPGTLMDTGDAMPCTEFVRPNPLDDDVIMDATARLLSARRAPASRPAARQEEQPAEKKRRGRKSPAKGHREERSAAPQKEQRRPRQDRSRQEKPRQEKAAHKAAPQEQRGEQKKHSRKRSGGGPRGPVMPTQADHTKDSTEQASLMKPFYINVGR